jgi:ribonuclease Z
MLAVEESAGVLLIDCGGDVLQRMMAAGLDPVRLHALVLTHEHPDHISGFPLLIEKLWLMGRTDPLPVYGPAPALAIARALFEAFHTTGWLGVPEREWHPIPLEAGAEVFSDDVFDVISTPVIHPVPTIGVRVRNAGGATVAYSADTAKCDAMVDIARNADVLVHEATGSQPGVHSSAQEAAEVAADAGAGRLVLVHLPPGLAPSDVAAAQRIFPSTEVGEELGTYPLRRSLTPTGIPVV